MKYVIASITLALLLSVAWFFIPSDSKTASNASEPSASFTEQEAGFEPEPEVTEYRVGGGLQYTIEELKNWTRPEGPTRVGLQVGHLDNDEVPQELSGLSRNGAGATAAGYNERDTVAVITGIVAELLEAEGILVDILPTTVPPGYVADAFVSIHADGNNNSSVRGFKIAGPRRDYSGRSSSLVADIETAYASATGLPQDPQITRRMSAYYAFNWARYDHAIHPYTPGVIVETGFLSNPNDRDFLINQPSTVAEGIATGILRFLENNPEPDAPPTTLTTPTLPLSGIVECAPVREERRNRDPRPCEAALRTADGTHYLLIANPPIATSSLGYRATVDGDYMPVQILDNYFWFHWEVLGMIAVSRLERAVE